MSGGGVARLAASLVASLAASLGASLGALLGAGEKLQATLKVEIRQ